MVWYGLCGAGLLSAVTSYKHWANYGSSYLLSPLTDFSLKNSVPVVRCTTMIRRVPLSEIYLGYTLNKQRFSFRVLGSGCMKVGNQMRRHCSGSLLSMIGLFLSAVWCWYYIYEDKTFSWYYEIWIFIIAYMGFFRPAFLGLVLHKWCQTAFFILLENCHNCILKLRGFSSNLLLLLHRRWNSKREILSDICNICTPHKKDFVSRYLGLDLYERWWSAALSVCEIFFYCPINNWALFSRCVEFVNFY